ncbi:MAG: S9 family peptidase [Desulfurococcales archaeon]|nr:S9 family peptidase [Desulfurococcales archaeon]
MDLKWNEVAFTKFTYLGDIQISRDGKFIAYTLTKADINKDKYLSTVVIHQLSSGSKKYIDNASMPRISPDGREVLVTRPDETTKKTEILLYEVETLSNTKIAEVDMLSDVIWSPDGSRILLVTPERRKDEHVILEDRTPAWFDTKGFLDGEKTLYKIIDPASKEVVDEFSVEFFTLPYFKPAVWHGKKIVYTVPNKDNPYKKFDIFMYEEGEKPEKILSNTALRAVDSNGQEILMLGKPKKELLSEHDFPYVWRDGEVTPVWENMKYNVIDGRITSDGDVYFTTLEEGTVPLYLRKNGEQPKKIVDGKLHVNAFSISEGGKVALLIESDTELAEVYILDNGKLSKLTNYNGPILQKLGIKKYEHFTYKSLDLELDGWFIRPGGDGKHPVIVFVHGGPKGMYGYFFKYEFQLFAHRGYYIVFVNPRGSNGYSEEFALKVINRTGLEDFQDIVNGVKKFLEIAEDADSERVGITGISYGGYMTNWALTQSKMFKAGISENGISYWLTSYAYSDIGLWFDKEIVGDNPLRNENYSKLSPLFYADNVSAPLLIIHSLEDYRCPLDQSLMFYHILKDLGKEVYLAVFRKGPHGHSIKGSPKHRAKRYKLMMEFFDRRLKEDKEFNLGSILKELKKI